MEEEIATIEREDLLSPATVGLTIAEGKVIHPGQMSRRRSTGVARRRGLANLEPGWSRS
jgi:hypothetical protein